MRLPYPLALSLLLAPALVRAGAALPVVQTPEALLAAAYAAEVASRLPLLGTEAAAMAARLAEFPPVAEPVVIDSLSLLAGSGGLVPVGAGRFAGRCQASRAAAPTGAVLSGIEAMDSTFHTPLVLNLGGGVIPDVPGAELEPHPFGFNAGRVAWFDMDGDGYPDLTEWPGPDLGLLVHAPGGLPPAVLTGADLIGSAGGYQDGFEHLAAFDLDGDDRVAGTELANLLVWRDSDSDGVPDATEWLTPAALRLTALNTSHIGVEGSYVANGHTQRLWDWWPTFCRARPDPAVAKAGAVFKATMAGVAPLAGGPAATAFTVFPLASTWELMDYDWLEAAGFVPQMSQLVAVAPRADGILLMDRPLAPPRQVRLWVLARDALAGGWRAHRFDFPEDGLEAVAYGGTGAQVLVCSRSGTRTWVIQAGQLYGPIGWTTPVGMGFRTAFAPPFAVGTSFYVPGYFHDANGVPLADSLAVLKVSKTKAALKSGADIRWLIGDGLPGRGYEVPRMVQVTSAKSAFAVSHDGTKAESVLLAIGGSDATKGTVRELDRAPQITALSACAGRVLYLVQQVGGTWEVRSVGTKGKAPVPVVWSRPNRPACIEYGYKGLGAFWERVNWAGSQVVMETADPVAGMGPSPAALPGSPGTLRVAALEPFFVLQRSYGLQLGLWRPVP